MKKVQLNTQQWDIVLQAMNNTPTQNVDTAGQIMIVMQEIRTQLVKEQNGTPQDKNTK